MKLKRALLLGTQCPSCFSHLKKELELLSAWKNASGTETNELKTYQTTKNNTHPTGLDM